MEGKSFDSAPRRIRWSCRSVYKQLTRVLIVIKPFVYWVLRLYQILRNVHLIQVFKPLH